MVFTGGVHHISYSVMWWITNLLVLDITIKKIQNCQKTDMLSNP